MTDLRALSEPRTEAGKRLERKVMADPNARVIDVVTHEDILDIEAESGSDAERPALDVAGLVRRAETSVEYLAEDAGTGLTERDRSMIAAAVHSLAYDDTIRILAAAPGDAERLRALWDWLNEHGSTDMTGEYHVNAAALAARFAALDVEAEGEG